MFYLNPPTMSKEQWLTQNATQVKGDAIKDFASIPADRVPCCWVDNGGFTAAGIALDADEHSRWYNAEDHRPKVYFLIPREVLFREFPEAQPDAK